MSQSNVEGEIQQIFSKLSDESLITALQYLNELRAATSSKEKQCYDLNRIVRADLPAMSI